MMEVEAKRTTIVIPLDVRKQLKHIAADHDTTMTMVITAAIYHFIDEYKAGRVQDKLFEKVRKEIQRMREAER